jgi:hypothetical protein
MDERTMADATTAADDRPPFLITIDTEGDNIWSNPKEIRTENARFLPRFQSLCERYGLKPTYLTNYEMACCSPFVEFARDWTRRATAEVGMHLHAWNSPPIVSSNRQGMPYLIEFPEEIVLEKVKFMTNLLGERFGVKAVSHRAGRWAFNETYARVLLDQGYLVDCSVTPNVSWRGVKGFSDGNGGTDYRRFPSNPYFLDPSDIREAGGSAILEVPMTIVADDSLTGNFVRSAGRYMPPAMRKTANRLFPEVRWFRPNGRNLASMLAMMRQQSRSGYVEFMLHSSELMAGGSPTFPSERSIDLLYDHLEQLFEEAQDHYRGATLAEFRDEFERSGSRPASRVG